MSDETTDLKNRSEIVFLTDAQDTNPNGNPKADNRPRIDPVTQQCVVTDVRLKRYLRDQLNADGHPIFVKTPRDEGAAVRAALALDLFEEIKEPDDFDDIDDVEKEFLERATDVRYFGATLSFNKDPEDELYQEVIDRFPSEFTGPVQFSPARSLNAVETNDEFDTLTSVIATQEGKETGGFDLDDHRIKYGIFPFHGVVDEHGAQDTRLTEQDVKRLDTLCWRAMKNQTISRSKFGQEPRLYLRVEYATDSYHAGDLHHSLEIDDERSADDAALRTVKDVTIDVSGLLESLSLHADHIDTVHVVGSERLEVSNGDELLGTAADLAGIIQKQTNVAVQEVDVYEQFEETLPA
jgi:CRISPR-associated protein Csh2